MTEKSTNQQKNVTSGSTDDSSPGKTNQETLSTGTKLSKKASLRLQKQSYKMEKKKAENDYKTTLNNPAVVILSDWLKIRSTLKNWSRVWCTLKPGLLVIYKNSKQKHWVGTASLSSVEVIERPSKKDGFCFKIYHTMDQCIWASKGPKGETASFLNNSLPTSYLIVRSQSESDGQCWIDAIEIARKCSNLLNQSLDVKSVPNNLTFESSELANDFAELQEKLPLLVSPSILSKEKTSGSISSGTKADKRVSMTDTIESIDDSTESCFSDDSSILSGSFHDEDCTSYVLEPQESIESISEGSQTGSIEGENKSLLWMLLKQVRPGMDLSKVVLPTFILEPRSFLDKLTDYNYHIDILSETVKLDNPYDRIKGVVKWYLSGFYKKPKGLKKPYNPILGETFRCKFEHPDTNSTTFCFAQQVSHHPPISAVVVSNRKDGFILTGNVLARSKFYGNSASAVLDGKFNLNFIKHGEEYKLTLPYGHCKGIIYGKITMEFGGKVVLVCEKTGYSAEIEFKLKPMFSGSTGKFNEISGKIMLGKRVLATLSGFWDETIHITDLNGGSVKEFWSVNDTVKMSRLKRYLVDISQQEDFESENLWQHVASAIRNQDQVKATEQKSILEDAQRKSAKERKENNQVWSSKYFEFDADRNEWIYKFVDTRPWDDLNDLEQFESKGIISTRTKHKTSPLRFQTVAGPSNNCLVQRLSSKSFDSNQSNNNSISYNREYLDIIMQTLSPFVEKQEKILWKIDQLDIKLQAMSDKSQEQKFLWPFVVVLCSVLVAAISAYLRL